MNITHVSRRIFFSATVRPVSLSFALYTTPYVPSPIFSSLWKASMWGPEKLRTFPLTSRHKQHKVQAHIFSFISSKQTAEVPACLLHRWLVGVSRATIWLVRGSAFLESDWFMLVWASEQGLVWPAIIPHHNKMVNDKAKVLKLLQFFREIIIY